MRVPTSPNPASAHFCFWWSVFFAYLTALVPAVWLILTKVAVPTEGMTPLLLSVFTVCNPSAEKNTNGYYVRWWWFFSKCMDRSSVITNTEFTDRCTGVWTDSWARRKIERPTRQNGLVDRQISGRSDSCFMRSRLSSFIDAALTHLSPLYTWSSRKNYPSKEP